MASEAELWEPALPAIEACVGAGLAGDCFWGRALPVSNPQSPARPAPTLIINACTGIYSYLLSSLTHSDRLRDWPLDAGATIEANPFGKVPTPAKTRLCFREMSDQVAALMDLVMLSLLCGVSD